VARRAPERTGACFERPPSPSSFFELQGRDHRAHQQGLHMTKPEWGTKRNCPKCGERFYDLGTDDPVKCIECGNEWTPEPVLKSKQPIPFEEVKKEEVAEPDADLADEELEDIDVDEDEDSPDNDVDLGGDDDLGVPGADEVEEES
jgi:uncharacterized protein (TIGR02300 family)